MTRKRSVGMGALSRLARGVGLFAAAAGALAAVAPASAIAGAQAAAASRRFDGFTPSFNLGQAGNGAVCEAKRNFDGPIVDHGGRVWNVSCRGWSNTLGTLYLFPGGGAESTWRAALAARADCASAVDGVHGPGSPLTCKTHTAHLAYVVFRLTGGRGVIAAEGRAPIGDALATGVAFMSGTIPEPKPIDKEVAAVSQVSNAPVSELSVSDGPPSPQALREAAYANGQDWNFSSSEQEFSDLAVAGGPDESVTLQAEALYNQALNASNNGRYDKAAIFFDRADKIAGQGDPSLRALALNYEAADARNQEDYEGAVELADQALAARASLVAVGGARDANGNVVIPEVGAADGTQRITRMDRERLRNVQALEIKATALESLGKPDQAREALLAARAILDSRLPTSGSVRRPIYLGLAVPWLNTRVWADLLRLDRGTPSENATEAQFRDSVAYFATRHPGSLPLAAFYLEQAGVEANLMEKSKANEDKAVADYKAAFEIFIDQRGSLADSADLARPYFDFLLKRIGDAPAAHPDDVKSFFNAAQALIAQSSAEAAKRQAATAQAGDDRTAALARALQDTERRQQANLAEIRKLDEQGIIQGPVLDRLRSEQKTLAEENAKLQGQLLEADPKYVSALHTLVSLDQLQKALRPDEVYVKVFLLAGGGYGMMVSPTEAVPYRINLTRGRADEVVAILRKPMDFPTRSKSGHAIHGTYNVGIAHELFEDVFGPVRTQVLAARHIVYEPDATLIAAPISALVVDDASVGLIKTKLAGTKPLDYVGVAWLGAHSYNSIALSASAFYQARNAKPSRAASPFYGFGDPVIPNNPDDFSSIRPEGQSTPANEELCARYRYSLTRMSPLPDTRTEVINVAKAVAGDNASSDDYVFGEAFTDTAVMARHDLTNYRVLYFATHGLLDDGNLCLRTSLLTSFGGQGSDALLDLNKITALHLDADMVVLSACNTGSNKDRSVDKSVLALGAPAGRSKLATPKLGNGGGEALGGLVTSFVEAGARNVVVSNWEVDSATTAKLMISLFKQRGISQAGALAQAERTLMNDPPHSHPYFWAPFTVVGDGDRPMPGA